MENAVIILMLSWLIARLEKVAGKVNDHVGSRTAHPPFLRKEVE